MKGAIRQLSFPGWRLRDYIAEAVDFLRDHEPPDGYFVGFSGGKDSIVTLQLCKVAKVKHHAFYNATGIDYPEIPKFIRKEYPEVTFIYPKESYWSLLRKNGPPMRNVRWCCNRLKEGNNDYKTVCMGIRAEESAKRA